MMVSKSGWRQYSLFAELSAVLVLFVTPVSYRLLLYFILDPSLFLLYRQLQYTQRHPGLYLQCRFLSNRALPRQQNP